MSESQYAALQEAIGCTTSAECSYDQHRDKATLKFQWASSAKSFLRIATRGIDRNFGWAQGYRPFDMSRTNKTVTFTPKQA